MVVRCYIDLKFNLPFLNLKRYYERQTKLNNGTIKNTFHSKVNPNDPEISSKSNRSNDDGALAMKVDKSVDLKPQPDVTKPISFGMKVGKGDDMKVKNDSNTKNEAPIIKKDRRDDLAKKNDALAGNFSQKKI